jgi:hypothetical protein
MANTIMLLSVSSGGKARRINVKLSGEELRGALQRGGALVRLPTGEDQYVYVNPTHIVMAQEVSGDPTPLLDASD